MDIALAVSLPLTAEAREWLVAGIRASVDRRAHAIGVDLGRVGRVIVADESSYGSAIRELSADPTDVTHTDIEFHKGVATRESATIAAAAQPTRGAAKLGAAT